MIGDIEDQGRLSAALRRHDRRRRHGHHRRRDLATTARKIRRDWTVRAGCQCVPACAAVDTIECAPARSGAGRTRFWLAVPPRL